MTFGKFTPVGATLWIGAERVDHRGETTRNRRVDDVVEDRESVRRCAQVVLAFADEGAQRIARHHVLGEVLGRPPALARTCRPDEDDEAWRRQLDHTVARATISFGCTGRPLTVRSSSRTSSPVARSRSDTGALPSLTY